MTLNLLKNNYNNIIKQISEVKKMAFNPKPTKQKVKAEYKTLYITSELVEKLNKLAKDYDTSFNNVVISIIEDFFNKNDN